MADGIVRIDDIVAWLRSVAPSAQLTSDSRLLNAGDAFFAYPGDSADGRNYIAAALQRGAAAVLCDDGDAYAWPAAADVPHRAVGDRKSVV